MAVEHIISPQSIGPTHTLVGDSPRMRQMTRLIEKLGHTRWPVLLLGETGTGKEVVARSIHQMNPTGPFVTIDCSALVGPLMESELFGHSKGSFTGAIQQKAGLIELANGGTAFLDEMGELPLDLQSKLLRVLQEKEFRPVGSLTSRKSDFRIIAATNRNLAEEVEKGTFRRDLYYRLNVVTLRLAPLRERKDDVPQLVNHFLARYGRNHCVTQEAMEAMLAYDWPGNVRELENCVQHMVALNSGPFLHLPDLPSSIQNHHYQQQMTALGSQSPALLADGSPSPMVTFAPTTVIPLSEVEKKAIMEALAYTKGDRTIAASLLGIGRTTLYRKLKEYNVSDWDIRCLCTR